MDRSQGNYCILPMPDGVIDRVNEMGRNQPAGLEFRGRDNDLYMSDNESDDESLDPCDLVLGISEDGHELYKAEYIRTLKGFGLGNNQVI